MFDINIIDLIVATLGYFLANIIILTGVLVLVSSVLVIVFERIGPYLPIPVKCPSLMAFLRIFRDMIYYMSIPRRK